MKENRPTPAQAEVAAAAAAVANVADSPANAQAAVSAVRVWVTTDLIVGALMGVGLMYTAFVLAGVKWGLALTALLLLEGWALVNSRPHDTISEAIWRFAERPMVPWLFGIASGWALNSGFLLDPWLIGAWFFLQGHFFFQRAAVAGS